MLAGARARRAGDLHRAEPRRALGAARRDALRLRPALQLRPARDAAAPAPLRPRAPRRRALPAAVAPQASGCRRRISGSGSGAASSRGRRRRAPGRGVASRSTPGRRAGGSGRGAGGRSRCSRACAGPSPEPVRGHGRRAAVGRAAAGTLTRGRVCGSIGVLPRCRPLCYHRADFAGDARPICARMHARPRSGPGADNGRVAVSELSILTSGVAGRYATALFEIARGRQAARRGRGRPRRARGGARATAPTSAT